MPIRQRLVTYGIPSVAVATVAIAAGLTPWAGSRDRDEAPTEVPTPVEPGTHPVDVVFAVDTTGSMGKLLDGAKRTVWSIAKHIKVSDPNADVRVGLVAYRDIDQQSGFVTKPFQLTGDLDAMYAELSTYTAHGGGDAPEDVAAGMDKAIHWMHWREGAKKIMFVVGDAPPIDRGDAPLYDVLARQASDLQIVVNAIRCGEDPDAGRAFAEIAQLGNGEFTTIRQDGGVQEVATPYDRKLGELQNRLDQTAVIMGEGARDSWRGKQAAAAAAPEMAKADRAAYKTMTKGAPRDDGDAVTAVKTGKMSVEAVHGADLPEELRGLSEDKLAAELARRADERAKTQHEIDGLVEQRDAYLKNKAKDSSGFDDKVKATVDRELAR
jgi:hypothetical protein